MSEPDPPTAHFPDRRARGAATTPAEQSFARRALIAVGIAVGVAALALFLWYAMYVLLLSFAAVLVGVLLRGSAQRVAARLGIAVGWGLGLVLVALVGFFFLVGYFAAPSIVRQVEALADRLPESIRQAEQTLRGYSWGRRILGEPAAAPDAPAAQSATQPTLVRQVIDAGAGGNAVRQATRVLNRVLQSLLTLFVVLVSGIYLAAQPRMYVNGLLMMVPHARRPRYREVLARLGYVLRWWMIGQLVPMAVIGTLTALGLMVIGVELWLILGLLAALFNFIPNFGPLMSGIPAFLLALADSPTKAMWVVVLYVCAQSLEGYVLTPLVQRKAVELPPALLILFQVLAGLLLGALGVVLAAPLLAVVVVAVKMLYVEDVLGDHPHVLGDAEEKTG
jgi:predicted PurR-regulated permease PerM